MTNEPDIGAIMVDVRRQIALGKLNELSCQAVRLGELVRLEMVSPSIVADTLHDAAVANGLVFVHGEELVQALIADGITEGAAI